MERALRLGDEFAVPFGDGLGHGARGWLELVVGHDAIDQAELVGALRGDVLAEQQQLERDLLAHHVRSVSRDGRGGQARLQLGIAEAGALRGDHEVAAERQAAAGAERIAVHGGDDRLVDARQQVEQGDAVVGVAHRPAPPRGLSCFTFSVTALPFCRR